MANNLTPQRGSVWIRDFDEGVILRLGSVLVPAKNNYFVELYGLPPNTANLVPVIFGNPEQVFDEKAYPLYVVTRTGMEPALGRWGSLGAWQEQSGVSGTEYTDPNTGLLAYSENRISVQAWPYDITYTVSVFARFEYEAQVLLKNLLRSFPPYGYIFVKDSLNKQRSYECFNNGAITDISDIVDVSDRLKGYSVNLQVIGEIDLTDPIETKTVQTVVFNSDLK